MSLRDNFVFNKYFPVLLLSYQGIKKLQRKQFVDIAEYADVLEI